MKVKREVVESQPAWVVGNEQVTLAVTELGGHMAPVTFFADTDEPVQPYYVSPWQHEGRSLDEPCLVPLRGDFFCFPFGANAEAYRGEQHVLHGETATRKWTCKGAETAGGVTCLTMTLRTQVRPGTVTKRLRLREGENTVYVQHVLEGQSGRTSLGHHATLAVPEEPGAMRVATSSFRLGMTNPGVVSDPAERQYQSLAIGKEFTSLRKVPTLWKDPAWADCTAFPARLGYTDLIAVFPKPTKTPSWTTATVGKDRWLWFALKDAELLPATILWISNRGRHNEPWDGRNRCLGLEDVCGFFADGLAASLKANCLKKAGIPTSVKLSARKPTTVNYIEGVARVPRGFDCVRSAAFKPGEVRFTSAGGKKVTVPVAWEFLQTGEL